MKYYNLFVLTALLVLGGCGQDTLTGVAEDGDARFVAKNELKTVPFEGYMDGYGWFNLSRTDCPTGSLPLDAIGAGEGSHIGAYEIFFEICSYAQVDPTNPTYVGTATITAAKGDELYVSYNGVATSPTTYREFDTVIGGTGRFENASGAFEHTGTFGPHPAGFSLASIFTGEISSVGSSK